MTAPLQPLAASADLVAGVGWRIFIPLLPPSQNQTDREFWRTRSRRLVEMEWLFLSLRTSRGLPCPVYRRARLRTLLTFPTARRRDGLNFAGGLKQWVDALVRAGWLTDDNDQVLHAQTPELAHVRGVTATELQFSEWGGGAE